MAENHEYIDYKTPKLIRTMHYNQNPNNVVYVLPLGQAIEDNISLLTISTIVN